MAPSGIATDRQRFMARIALLRTFILLRVNVLTILWLDKRQKVSQLAIFFVFFVVLAKDPSIHRRIHPSIHSSSSIHPPIHPGVPMAGRGLPRRDVLERSRTPPASLARTNPLHSHLVQTGPDWSRLVATKARTAFDSCIRSDQPREHRRRGPAPMRFSRHVPAHEAATCGLPRAVSHQLLPRG